MGSVRQKRFHKKAAQRFANLTKGNLPRTDRPVSVTSSQEVPKSEDLILKEDIFKLESFGLSHEICYALSENKIRKVGDLAVKSAKDVLEFHGFGPVRLEKIRQALLTAGSSLRN